MVSCLLQSRARLDALRQTEVGRGDRDTIYFYFILKDFRRSTLAQVKGESGVSGAAFP